MASRSERARWSAWYDQVAERMANQKQAITRLVLITTQQRAALLEIANDEAQHEGVDPVVAYHRLSKIAARCLDLTESYATAVPQQAEELRDQPDPADPRKKDRA